MTEQQSDTSQLKRSLGLFGAVLVTVGAVIGSGIFVALGPAAEAAGTGLLAAMITAGLVALMNGLSSSQLGINFPVSGGTYAFARKVGLGTLGFIAGTAFLGKEVIGLSVIALTFATYSAQAISGLPVSPIAAATLIAVTILNYIGLELTTRVLIGLTLGKVLLLLGFIVFAIPSIEPVRLTPILGTGPLGILGGAAVFFFAFAGYSRIATIAGEIEEPRRNIPLGITVGFAISAAIFLLVGVVTLGVLGAQETAAQEVPVFAAADAALGRLGGWTVLGAAWLATLSVLVGGVLGVSRVALAMGEARELPIWLAAVHPRFRTPHRSVLALGLGSAVLALIFDLRPLLEVTNLFTLVYYAITNWAALRLRPEQRTLPMLLSWLGLAGCLALLVALPIPALLAGGLALLILLGARQFISR